LSVTLHTDEERLLAAFADKAAPEHRALVDWAVEHRLVEAAIGSDAAVLRLLVRAGAEAIQARAMDVGYAALGLSYQPGENAEHRTARQRYADRTDRHVQA